MTPFRAFALHLSAVLALAGGVAAAASPEETVRALWKDWAKLLKIGVKTGQMMTMDGLSKKAYDGAMASRSDRHWVYHRTGQPCRVCGTPIVMEEIGGRKLYWCPVDQA